MIKNKDGSYNKFSLLIIFLIGIIGTGIIGSTLITETPNVDPMILAYIGLIISGGLTLYYGKKVFFKSKPNIQTVEDKPIVKIEERIKIPREEPTGSGFGISGITSMIITLVIAGVGLMIGTAVLNSMLQALPEVSSDNPTMSSSMAQVTGTVSSAFNIAAIGLLVLGLIGMIAMLKGFMFTDHYDY
jgi:hypothetical protein